MTDPIPRIKVAYRWVGLALALPNGVLVVLFVMQAAKHPSVDLFAFAGLCMHLMLTGVVEFFAPDRDRLPLLTWSCTLCFAGMLAAAIVDPRLMTVAVTAVWGVISLAMPVSALLRPAPPHPLQPFLPSLGRDPAA